MCQHSRFMELDQTRAITMFVTKFVTFISPLTGQRICWLHYSTPVIIKENSQKHRMRSIIRGLCIIKKGKIQLDFR